MAMNLILFKLFQFSHYRKIYKYCQQMGLEKIFLNRMAYSV